MNKKIDSITWDQDVTIYNKVVLKQLGLAFGIPFGLIFIFLLIQYISDTRKGYTVSFDGWQYALFLIGIWLALTALLTMGYTWVLHPQAKKRISLLI